MKNNVPDILKVLPQCYPFLMVDRVVKISTNTDKPEIVVLKNVTNNEPHFQGHFPNNPVMPGALILEAMFQTGGLYAAHIVEAPDKGHAGYITTVDKVRFRKAVVPGDQLYLKVSLLNKISTTWRFTGKAYVDDIVVAEATWTGVLVKEST